MELELSPGTPLRRLRATRSELRNPDGQEHSGHCLDGRPVEDDRGELFTAVPAQWERRPLVSDSSVTNQVSQGEGHDHASKSVTGTTGRRGASTPNDILNRVYCSGRIRPPENLRSLIPDIPDYSLS